MCIQRLLGRKTRRVSRMIHIYPRKTVNLNNVILNALHEYETRPCEAAGKTITKYYYYKWSLFFRIVI